MKKTKTCTHTEIITITQTCIHSELKTETETEAESEREREDERNHHVSIYPPCLPAYLPIVPILPTHPHTPALHRPLAIV